MLDISARVLLTLIVVAETGSFTTAAERLGFTQPAVSKQIRALESSVGVPLFRRKPRGIETTAAGRMLLTRAKNILDQFETASLELAGAHESLSGRIRVGAFPIAASTLIPQTIRSLQHDHPALELDLQIASTPTQLRRLRAGTVQVGVLATGSGLPDYDLSGLRMESLPGPQLLVAVPEHHRFSRNERTPVTELANEEWITGKGAPGDPQLGAWPTLPHPRIAFSMQEWTARLGFVAAGLGITALPGFAKASVPDGVRTVEIDDPHQLERQEVIATRPERSRAVSAIVDHLLRQAAHLSIDRP